MGQTLQEVLVKALEELTYTGLKRFIDQLSGWKVRKEYKNIPKSALTEKNPETIAHLITKSYRDAYGAEVTLAVLEDIEERKVRQELQNDLRQVDISGQGLGTTMFTDRVHFIDNLGSDLITTIAEVDPVLCNLRDQNLLTEEQYNDLMKKTTSQEKMEELCNIVSHWKDTGKYSAYTAIKNDNEFFFKRLEVDWMRRNLLDKVHFIGRYRSDLITRIMHVDRVLRDLLQQRLLIEEQYNKVMKEMTSLEKMGKLCDIISQWDDDIRMHKAYRVLRKYNKNIMRRLEVKDMVWINAWCHVWGADHFVDRHRYHLMYNIEKVNDVLQDLQNINLLNWADCRDLHTRTEPEEKMKLLSFIFRIQSDGIKDQFYISLWRHNYMVINNLEKSDKKPRSSVSMTGYKPEAGGHFIDRHKEDLINRITEISLSNLYHKDLLTTGELEYIEQILNPKELMRLLYDIMGEWDEDEKAEVYQMLNKFNPWVFNDLKLMEKSSTLEESKGAVPARSRSVWILLGRRKNRTAGSQFLDKHKQYLIKRIMYVHPVINDLCHEDLLISAEFDYRRNSPNCKVVMRLLYDVIRDWDDDDKDKVYQMLYKHNPSVIDDLIFMEKSSKFEKPIAGAWSPLEHFVDRHREAVIKGTSFITPVLDDLLSQRLLTKEQYDTLCKMHPTQEALRQLYVYMTTWGSSDKEKFYQALKKHNKSLIRELEHEDTIKMDYEGMSTFKDETSRKSKMSPSYSEISEDDLSCTLCHKSEKVITSSVITPIIIERTYCLRMDSPGLFQCSESGIQFLVTQPVTLEYEVDSWSNFSEILQTLPGGYEVIGPLFNITSAIKPNVVSAVYLPHCLCLGGFKGSMSLIKCFHYKDDKMTLETPSRVEAMYVVLENPTFSRFGVFLSCLKGRKRVRCHGMVLLFCNTIIRENQNHMYRLHLYLLPRIRTAEKAVVKVEKQSSFQRVPKPPQTKTVYSKKNYKVIVPQNAIIDPPTLMFDSRPPNIYPYTEIRINGEPDTEVNVSVLLEDDDDAVWRSVVSAEEMLILTSAISRLSLQSGDSRRSRYPGEHFLDYYRRELIIMINFVDPILDDLLTQKLLISEQYHTVRSKSTPEEKMRQLYDYITYWSDEDKDEVYKALEARNPRIIKRLKNGASADH